MSIRAAVVGAGYAGSQHIDALRQIGDVEVAVVVERSEERADDAARRLGLERTTADPHATLADDIDVVHVCTPTDVHLPFARAALAAGKHVICEKPLALDLDGASELAQAAAGSKRLALVGLNYRCFSGVLALRALVAAGDLGAVHGIRGSFLQEWLLTAQSDDWRLDPARAGASRAMNDIGCHLVDVLETVLGARVVSVCAELAALDRRRADDTASLLLTFDGGVGGAAVISQIAAGHANDVDVTVDGSLASAFWHNARPNEVRIARPGREPEVLVVGAAPAPNESRRALMRAAYDRIFGRANDVPLPTFDDGLHQMRLTEAMLVSARERAWVPV